MHYMLFKIKVTTPMEGVEPPVPGDEEPPVPGTEPIPSPPPPPPPVQKPKEGKFRL